MKNNKLRKNVILSSITAFALILLQSNFIYAYGHLTTNALPQGANTVNGTTDITSSGNKFECYCFR